jgi:hypothetical protein
LADNPAHGQISLPKAPKEMIPLSFSINPLKMNLPLLIVMAACLIPAFFAFRFIHRYGVSVVFWDDFSFVHLFPAVLKGTITAQDLLALHTEHLMFFGRLAMLALGFATHLNSVAQMYASWAFVLLTEFVLLRLAVKTLGLKVSTIALFLPIAFLLFSLRAYEVFLLAIIIVNSMTIFFFVSTVYFLSCIQQSSHSWRDFLMAIVFGIFTTFTGAASALTVWPIGLLQLVPLLKQSTAVDEKSLRWKMIYSWLGASLLCFAIYGYQIWLRNIDRHQNFLGSSLQYVLYNKKAVGAYALTLFGNPFGNTLSPDLQLMQIYGAALLLLCLTIIIAFLTQSSGKKLNAGTRVALSIFLFGLVTDLLIVFGRTRCGEITQATSPRYVQFTNLLLIGAYLAVVFSEFRQRHLKYLLLAPIITLVLVESAVGYGTAKLVGTILKDRHQKFAYILRTYKMQSDDNLKLLNPYPDRVREAGAMLEELKLNVFHEPIESCTPINQ